MCYNNDNLTKALFTYNVDSLYSTFLQIFINLTFTSYLFLTSRNLPYLIPYFWIRHICHPMSLFHWSFTFNSKAKLFERNNLSANPTWWGERLIYPVFCAMNWSFIPKSKQ